MNAQDTLILTRSQVAELMRFDDYVSAVDQAFRSYALGKTRLAGVVDIEAIDGAFHIKAASMETKQKYVAVKVNGNFPKNAARFDLPTIQGAILLYDATTGFPLAFMDSIEITIQRTAAATTLGAKHFARSNSTTVLICGGGNQGRASLLGLHSILPIERAFVFDTNNEIAKRFSEDMSSAVAVPVTPVSSLREAARTSDVIVTCTPARSPFLGPDDVSAGTFIAAVGADSHDKQELDSRLLASHKVVVDILEQCATIGELHHALKVGLVKKSDVYAELGEVVAGSKAGRTSADEVIILDTTGAAIQDVAAAALAFERARERGIGTFTRLA